MKALRWEELATVLVGDKYLTHLFRGSASCSDDVPTDRILATIDGVHDKVFLSPMSDPDLSLTPWAKEVVKVWSPHYAKKDSNNIFEPDSDPDPSPVDRHAENESLLPESQEKSSDIVASFAPNIRLRKLPSHQ